MPHMVDILHTSDASHGDELLQMLKIDDPVEAFPVHGACGIWGVLAVPLFDINTFGVGGDLYGPGISMGASLVAQP